MATVDSAIDPSLAALKKLVEAAQAAARAAEAAKEAAQTAAEAAAAAEASAAEAAAVAGPAAVAAAVAAAMGGQPAFAKDVPRQPPTAASATTISATSAASTPGEPAASSIAISAAAPSAAAAATALEAPAELSASRRSSIWKASLPVKFVLRSRMLTIHAATGGSILSKGAAAAVVERSSVAGREQSLAERSASESAPSSSAGHAPPAGPSEADIERYLGTWRAGGVENRDEFLKAMALPWILRKIPGFIPVPPLRRTVPPPAHSLGRHGPLHAAARSGPECSLPHEEAASCRRACSALGVTAGDGTRPFGAAGKIAAALPQPDNVFFLDEDGTLRSHSSSLGKVVEEVYKEGGKSTKTFKGVTTTVTYHWEGAVLTYVAVKDGAPEEEASSKRWIEPDGVTMRAESIFRKNSSLPFVTLRRTWVLDPHSRK